MNDQQQLSFKRPQKDNNIIHTTNNDLRNLRARGEGAVNGPVLSEKAPNLGPPKTPKTLRDHISDARRARLAAPKNPKTLSEASERGLVAVWAATFGYVAIHDPLAGEWHDVQTKEAPGWALREASTRKTLYRGGDRRAYSYNAREMGE